MAHTPECYLCRTPLIVHFDPTLGRNVALPHRCLPLSPEVWPAPIPEPENVLPKLPINPKRKNLREEAERWIKENPSAYSALEAAALSSLAAGTPMTMELLIGWARKNTSAKKDDDGFKINDHHGAYLARRLAADFPQLEKCFRFRKTRY